MSSYFKCNERETARLPVLGLKEAACLEPHYAKGAPYIADVLGRSCCIPIRKLPPPHGDLHEILSSFLGKDDLEYELDDNNRLMGVLNCTPPTRANNPLVYDVKFVHENLVKDSAFGNPLGSMNQYSGLKVPCHGTSEQKSTIRIEGFASGKF
ncbi:hypothetical protein JCGZ_26899 [Jatropha curcas]|uniref:Uncharacterized protein n=1 Tax=Jatropha curcas TaxID=180498 RepID=A0A067L0A2_JATCU|nr:hypothetical protein JCGZ_26899 [Jatropha curcas]